MEIANKCFVPESPAPAAPIPPAAPLPFFRYLRTMRHNAIAGYHDDVYRRPLVEIRHPRLHTFLLNDPDGIRHVLIDNADNYIKGGVEQRGLRTLSRKPPPDHDEKKWRHRRRIISSSFDHRSILETSPVIADAVQRALARWDVLPKNAVIETHAEMSALALDIISRVVFSVDSAKFARIMERASMRYQPDPLVDPIDFVPLLDRAWELHKRFRRHRIFHELNASIDRLIADRARQRSIPVDDFLERLLRTKDQQTGSAMSPQEVHDHIITVLGTGHETASMSLMWTWYLLSQHPQQEARLHAEVVSVLAGRTPAIHDVARLPYTRMVIEESLRLYPPNNTLPWRRALRDDLVCGVKIPRGATVSIVPWVLHRHKNLWDQPERFDPERFSPDCVRGRSRFAYLPFGIGPRVCVGASFAMTEMILILASIAQRYRLCLVPGHKVEPQGLILLRARYGMKMTLESRFSNQQSPA